MSVPKKRAHKDDYFPTYAPMTQPVYSPPLHSPIEITDTTPLTIQIQPDSSVQAPIQTPVQKIYPTFQLPDPYASPVQPTLLPQGGRPKKISAHALDDGYYRILEDEMEHTLFGLQRTLVLEPHSPSTLKTWIPKQCPTPDVSLVGYSALKSTLESDDPKPFYGKNYSLVFQ